MVLEIMIEDNSSGRVDEAELVQWADNYGLTMPVLSDPNGGTMWSYAGGGSIGLPFTLLMDRGVIIADATSPTEADVERLIR